MSIKFEFTEEVINYIIDNTKKGVSLVKICDKYNITPNQIKSYVKKSKEFAELYRDAQSLYSQRKVDEIENISKEIDKCEVRADLTKLKAQELKITCITKSLGYLFPERYKEKSNELFISLPEYGEATNPKDRLMILAKAVCEKKISVDAAEKLAKMCEIELKVTDFAVFSDTVSQRIERLENIIVKANGLLPQANRVNKDAQY